MNFNIDQDFSIFNNFLSQRPHYKPEALKKDIQNYYLPFIKKLLAAKEQNDDSDGLVVGISAIQGAGKTTQGKIFEILLQHFQLPSCSLSIDDHYVTHEDLVALREEDQRYIRRGVTHDISLAIDDLTRLKKMRQDKPIVISGYDKGAHRGDGDRFRWVNSIKKVSLNVKIESKHTVVDTKKQEVKTIHLVSANYDGIELELPDSMGSDIPVLEGLLPADLCEFLSKKTDVRVYSTDGENVVFEDDNNNHVDIKSSDLPNGWRVIAQKPEFIFYDGWMLGAFPVTDESVFESGLPGLETEEAKEWAKATNLRLALYEPLWDLIDFLSILYVPNYHMSLLWREQAEEALRAKGQGMSSDEIKEFVHYFWRSVHPAVHIKNLAHDSKGDHQVVIIDDDRTIKEVIDTQTAREKYS